MGDLMSHQKLPLSIVVPCYNEEDSLGELVRRVRETCAGMEISFELILVDDGSSDRTWECIEAQAAEYNEIVGVKLSRNHGHQIALTAGLVQARGQRILMMDADLQDPPELLEEMMQTLDDGADVAYGKRNARRGESIFKKVTAYYFYKIINRLTDGQIPRDTGDFRLVSRRALDTFLQMNERFRFVRGMFSWIGYDQRPVLYDRDPRYAGETKYTLSKMIRFAVDAITSFSISPLRFSVHVSLFALFVAMATTAYVLGAFFFAQPAPGWASILLVLSFFSAVQLLCIGIIGEYVGRLFMELKGRPLFIVEEVNSGGVVSDEKMAMDGPTKDKARHFDTEIVKSAFS